MGTTTTPFSAQEQALKDETQAFIEENHASTRKWV
jgi:hypothetical protein